MSLLKKVFSKTKKVCAWALVMSMLITSLSFAEGNNNATTQTNNITQENNSSNTNSINEDNKTDDEEKGDNENLDEEKKENSNSDNENSPKEKKDEDEADDTEKKDKVDEPKEEKKDFDDKTDVEKKATDSEATSEEENSNSEAEENESDNDIEKKAIATKSEADESDMQEAEIATSSDALMGDPVAWYSIRYHYVLPNNTRNGYQTTWTEIFEGRTSAQTFERMYYVDYHYDEMDSAAAYGDGFGSHIGGIFTSYHTYDIVTGYDLVGWNTNEEDAKNGIKTYGVSPAKESPVTTVNQSHVDLYAVFEPIPLTISFDINDERKGSGSTRANVDDPASKTVYWGDRLTFLNDDDYTSATINRPGYEKILGWSKFTYFSLYKNVTEEDKQLAHISESDVNLMSSNDVCDRRILPSNWNGSNKVWKPGMTVKLYAVWQPKVYKIKLHWPMLSNGDTTYEDYLKKCKEAAAREGEEFLMVFDNDLEAVQSFNQDRGYSNPMRVMHLVPQDFFAGAGTDPNCTDVSTVKLTLESYWFEQVPDNTELELYYILSDNMYRDSVRIKIDLNGGFHRMWTQYDLRMPIGTSYNGMFYTGLLSNLQRPGFTLQKLVKVNPDGSEEDFDPNQEVTASNKSAEVLALIAQYDQAVKAAEPIAERYYEMKKLGMKKIQDAKDNDNIEELYASDEFKQFVEEFEDLEKQYNEAIARIPYLEMVRTYDLVIKCIWTGKQLKGTFDYSGNRMIANKIQGQTLTSKIVTYGERIGDLPVPTANGYTFKGWKTGRGLGAQYAWKDVTSDTLFDKAELFESELLQMNYDEREFEFYADWEPITLSLGVTDSEYDEAEVTFGNEFKFGEPSVLDVHGEWTVSSPSTLTGSKLFGGNGDVVKEVYGIEILDDYYTDQENPTQKQVAGTKYYNGDTVTLYKNAGETLHIKPIWRDKQGDSTPTNPSNPTNPTNPSSSTINTNVNRQNPGTPPSGGNGGSSNTYAGVSLPLTNFANQTVVQQTLQQTMNTGKFEKAAVNTASLDIKSVSAATSTWKVNPTTGKWSLSGTNALGQATAPVNCFCQVNTVLAKDVYGMKAGDTVTDTYYFDAAGNMVTGWMQTSDNKWYFFSDQKDGNEGKMSIGWTKVAGNWYYFTSNGSLQTSGTTPDGKTVDANGMLSNV